MRWLKREGDPVEKGDPLVELETEKISYELESPAAGILLRVVAEENAEVPVGDPLCEIDERKEVSRSHKPGGRNAKTGKPKSRKAKK